MNPLRKLTGYRRQRAAVLLVAVGAVASGCGTPPPRTAPDDRIPFTAATVTDRGDGRFTLSWTAPGAGRVKVYTGTAEDRIRTGRAVASGGGRVTTTVRVGGRADRQWFRFVPSRGEPLTLADRSVRLEGAANVRDAGGYRTADGRWVRMGRLYRSGGLQDLTDADRATLRRLGIGPVYDLRTRSEAAADPDRLPEGADYRRLNVLGDGRTIANTVPHSPDEARSLMSGSYRDFVSAGPAPEAYRKMFTSLPGAGDSSVHSTGSTGGGGGAGAPAALYHCTVGKDRTGWASAVLLRALGVPRSTVERDYLASNRYLERFNEQALHEIPEKQHATFEPLMEVKEKYLDLSFDEMDEVYGSLRGYLHKGLGIDDEELGRLRAELLVG